MTTSSEQPDDKIIQYLDGELTGKELEAFEKLLAQDPAMREELRNLELARLAVQHYALKQQVATMHQDMMAKLKNDPAKPSGDKIYPFMRLTMRVAASLLVLMIVFAAYEFISVSPAKLSQENYHAYEMSVTRGEPASTQIEKDYADKNFSAVIADFEKNTSPAPSDDFLAAQAYLATHQPARAIPLFNTMLNSRSTDHKDDSEYYLAISYLQNGQAAKAKYLLDKIYHDKYHLYHDQVGYWTMLRLKLLIIKDPGQ